MQGYDAVALNTDVQIGGTDQLFNLMAGRKLMEAHGMRPQVVLTSRILVGTDGVQRMSKSTGNYIGIDEPPGVIFTKVLNVPDSAMRNYAELVTRWSQQEINHYFEQLQQDSLEMRELKHKLAWEIVSIFHGDAAADMASTDAALMHQGEAPSDAPTFRLNEAMPLVDLLQHAEMVKSKSEGRRLIQQGGIRINGSTIENIDAMVMPAASEQIIQVGKRKFLRILQ
jgi:tyrosyl-tRNA synthetase